MKASIGKLSGVWLLALILLQGCGGAAQSAAEEQSTVATPSRETDAATQTPGFTGLPGWAEEAVLAQQLHQKYSQGTWMQPNILSGDFDGDAQEDVAFLVTNKATGEKGVLILHQDAGKTYSVLGAGTAFEEMRDLDWIEVFEKMEAGRTVAPTLIDEETGDILGEDLAKAVQLTSDAIFVHQAEACGGGVIYRKGKVYTWINIE